MALVSKVTSWSPDQLRTLSEEEFAVVLEFALQVHGVDVHATDHERFEAPPPAEGEELQLTAAETEALRLAGEL